MRRIRLLLLLVAVPGVVTAGDDHSHGHQPLPDVRLEDVAAGVKDLFRSLQGLRPPDTLSVTTPDHADGLSAVVSWNQSPSEQDPRFGGYLLLRADDDKDFVLVQAQVEEIGDIRRVYDRTTPDPRVQPPPKRVTYRVITATNGQRHAAEIWQKAFQRVQRAPDDQVAAQRLAVAKQQLDVALLVGISEPISTQLRGSWFDTSRMPLLLLLVAMGALMLWYTARIRRIGPPWIRRIPGIDAIEEAIGRATEMGKPVLYVPGIDELQDLQTIASMLILGRVSEIIARYDTDIIVSCCIPVVREVADEVVQAGYFEAGRPDSFRAENIRFISSEQFAFTAGTNGIMYREKPAANIFLGKFFAESLILSETGFVNGSIQVAGTAEPSQLPFFIAACDYTIIGEELFAVSAYLSGDPRLVSSLSASDWVKAAIILILVGGTVLSSFGITVLTELLTVGG